MEDKNVFKNELERLLLDTQGNRYEIVLAALKILKEEKKKFIRNPAWTKIIDNILYQLLNSDKSPIEALKEIERKMKETEEEKDEKEKK